MFVPTPPISLPAASRADNGLPAATDHQETIAAFFDAYGNRLPRKWLWELLKSAMGSEQSGTWKGEQRADYMLFCERLADLV